MPGDYTEYCNTMDKRGTWGDHVTLQVHAPPHTHHRTRTTAHDTRSATRVSLSRLTLQCGGAWTQAAANVYGVEIHLLTSYKDTVWMEIKPQDGAKTQKSLWLSFLAELHYNSLYSRQGNLVV